MSHARRRRPVAACRASMVAAALVLLAAAVARADIQAQASMSGETLFQNVPFIYQVAVSDAAAEPVIRWPEMADDFVVQPLPPSRQESHSSSFINGVGSSKSSVTVVQPFRITPKKAGRLTLPGPTITVGAESKRFESREITVRRADGDGVVFLDLSASRNLVYPEVPVTLTLTVRVKAPPGERAAADPVASFAGRRRFTRALDVPFIDDKALEGVLAPTEPARNWLQSLESEDGTGFTFDNDEAQSLFARAFPGRFDDERRFNLHGRRVTWKPPGGESGPYWEYVLSRDFRAKSVGVHRVGVARFRGEFADAGFMRPFRATSNDLSIEVKPLPTAGQPKNFTGAVGAFMAAAALDRSSCNVGDVAKLTLTLTGAGRLEGTPPPALDREPGIARKFKVYADPPAMAPGRRTFSYRLRPLAPGRQTIPPIELSYFDIDTESYKTVFTPELSLDVKGTATLADAADHETKQPSTKAASGDASPRPDAALASAKTSADTPYDQPVNDVMKVWHQTQPPWLLCSLTVLLLAVPPLVSATNMALSFVSRVMGADDSTELLRAAIRSARADDARGDHGGALATLMNLARAARSGAADAIASAEVDRWIADAEPVLSAHRYSPDLAERSLADSAAAPLVQRGFALVEPFAARRTKAVSGASGSRHADSKESSS